MYINVCVSGSAWIDMCINSFFGLQGKRTYWLGALPRERQRWRDARRVPDPMPPGVPPTNTGMAAIGVLQQVP